MLISADKFSFAPYVLFEIPSNVLLKRFKPHVWCKFPDPHVTDTEPHVYSGWMHVFLRPHDLLARTVARVWRARHRTCLPRYVICL